MNQRFHFSVIRIVPDPIKFEPLNVGVVVLAADGSDGDILYNPHVRSKLHAYRRDFPVSSVFTIIEEIRNFLGLDPQRRLGESTPRSEKLGSNRLSAAARYFENQVQLSEPTPYQAASVREALLETYSRYVSKRLPTVAQRSEITAAEMRGRIWQAVRAWKERNVIVERHAWLRSEQTGARHPADFVIRNGTARAALFALASSDSDRATTYLYRDSLPTIAQDMGDHFVAYAVLPDIDADTPQSTRAFVKETESFLEGYPQVKTVPLANLDDIERDVVTRLL